MLKRFLIFTNPQLMNLLRCCMSSYCIQMRELVQQKLDYDEMSELKKLRFQQHLQLVLYDQDMIQVCAKEIMTCYKGVIQVFGVKM